MYELRPGLDVVYQRARVRVNAAGFRGPLPSPIRRAGVFTIVGLGDSIMFGQGVADDETYMAQLEALLRARNPFRDWETVNTAVPGYNTVMEVETLKEKGLRFCPQLVVMELVGNDLDLPNFIRLPDPPWRSLLFDFVRDRWNRLVHPHRPRPLSTVDLAEAPRSQEENRFEYDPSRVPADYRDMVGWPAFETALRDLGRLSEKHEFTVVMLTMGTGELDARVKRLAKSLGFDFLHMGSAIGAYLRQRGFGE